MEQLPNPESLWLKGNIKKKIIIDHPGDAPQPAAVDVVANSSDMKNNNRPGVKAAELKMSFYPLERDKGAMCNVGPFLFGFLLIST